MRYLISAALAAGLVLAPTIGEAAHLKKHRMVHLRPVPGAFQVPTQVPVDPSGGNGAAAGNNANSMSGSNSAGENANGRSSGGGYGG